MNRIGKTLEQLTRTTAKKAAFLAVMAGCLTVGNGNLFAQQVFHNWSNSSGGWSFTNYSTAGAAKAMSTTANPAWIGLSTPAITQPPITLGFMVGKPGDTVDFYFSAGYAWGKGGQAIIGNIHNYFEYTLSAWDFANKPIDINQWSIVGDFPYGSTSGSKTSRTASGNSSKFSVVDPGASANFGQGGVLWMAGLMNIAHMQLTLTNNNLGPNNHGSNNIVFNVATPDVIQNHCTQPATGFDGKPVKASWDIANCYIKPVVAGTTPFIWNNSYYVTADKSTQCVAGAGSWDLANCYFMPKPAGGFIVNDGLYVPPGIGNSCSMGTFNGTGCLVKAAPWGTHAFEYQNAWYFTSLFTCKDGGYDGANCYIMSPPSGTIAFIYANNFYYGE